MTVLITSTVTPRSSGRAEAPSLGLVMVAKWLKTSADNCATSCGCTMLTFCALIENRFMSINAPKLAIAD